MNPFVERHQDKIAGVHSCLDRVVITGTLPDICHAQAMAGYLSDHGIWQTLAGEGRQGWRWRVGQKREKTVERKGCSGPDIGYRPATGASGAGIEGK